MHFTLYSHKHNCQRCQQMNFNPFINVINKGNQRHKKKSVLFPIAFSAFDFCTFSNRSFAATLVLHPRFTYEVTHPVSCDGCYHARNTADGEFSAQCHHRPISCNLIALNRILLARLTVLAYSSERLIN